MGAFVGGKRPFADPNVISDFVNFLAVFFVFITSLDNRFVAAPCLVIVVVQDDIFSVVLCEQI